MRAEPDAETSHLRFEAASVDLARAVVLRDGAVAKLTPIELALLRHLARAGLSFRGCATESKW